MSTPTPAQEKPGVPIYTSGHSAGKQPDRKELEDPGGHQAI